MYPNTEFFLVHIFPYLDGIPRFTEQISIFSPNTGKYGPEKNLYLDTFHAVYFMSMTSFHNLLFFDVFRGIERDQWHEKS